MRWFFKLLFFKQTKPAIVLLQMLQKLEAQTLETIEGRVVGQQRQSLPEPTQLLLWGPLGPDVQVHLGGLRTWDQNTWGLAPSFHLQSRESEVTSSTSLWPKWQSMLRLSLSKQGSYFVTRGILVFHLTSTFSIYFSFSVCFLSSWSPASPQTFVIRVLGLF